MATSKSDSARPTNFIQQIIADDLASGGIGSQVTTRFPPEPNGYLHIGHAKSICLNFGIAAEHDGGVCYLRFDDTNPLKESAEYEASMEADVRWLGFDWGERLRHASDYFDQLYRYALDLIEGGKAYVDSLSQEDIRQYRGTPWEPGRDSPFRNRSVEENHELFQRMRAGEFADGAHVLRAKIDMTSPNLHLRDPIIYRIRHFPHHRTGDRWCIYPMYDFTQCLSDAIEGVTHSLCTLEFEDNRALYDWFLDQLVTGVRPRQIEFARLKLNYTVMSKRRLNELVVEGHVSGWDDPRMPTLIGLRRRGYTPEAIRDFCERIGVTRTDTVIDVGVLENCVREDLNRGAPRVMAVLRPLRVVIENYPQGQVEWFDAPNHPNDPAMGTRKVPFSGVLYIERDDFMVDPPAKFFRLAPGREVRLRYAYFVKCVAAVRDERNGEVVELRCTYDPQTRGGSSPDGRRVKGTVHWVCAEHALAVEVRLYDRLFETPQPGRDGRDFRDDLNPASLTVLSGCRVEPSLVDSPAESRFQFERQGYFCVDRDSISERLVFNRTVTLRDTWARIAAADAGSAAD
jgi:glutaminyl-tRNA synthetase